MNAGLNPDFSESGLDFKNPIISLSGLKQISEFEFEFVNIRIEFKINQIKFRIKIRNLVPCSKDCMQKDVSSD